MNEEKEHQGLIEFLLNPFSYPHKPRHVKYIQTHASHVFIVPPYVYKVKKPVNLGFLDFSTLDKRKHYCEKEVELNMRVCDAYLGVEEISTRNGGFTFGEGDEIIEYTVKMRKLPERYFLKNLLARGKVNEDDLLRVVEKLVRFYKGQPVNANVSEYGKPEKIRINEELSCEVASSDVVRKEITGVGRAERRYEGFDKGIYSREITDMTYREILNRGKKAVEIGKTVILDASFSKREHREIVIHEAETLGILFYFIETKAGEESIRERLIEREKRGDSISDGRLEIFEKFKEDFEEPTDIPKDKHLTINTDNTLEGTLIQTLKGIIGKRDLTLTSLR